MCRQQLTTQHRKSLTNPPQRVGFVRGPHQMTRVQIRWWWWKHRMFSLLLEEVSATNNQDPWFWTAEMKLEGENWISTDGDRRPTSDGEKIPEKSPQLLQNPGDQHGLLPQRCWRQSQVGHTWSGMIRDTPKASRRGRCEGGSTDPCGLKKLEH